MLSEQEKETIIELRKRGFSYQKIHKKTGFAIDTIMKVIKEWEKKTLQETNKNSLRIKNNKNETSSNFIIENDSTITNVKQITKLIDHTIKKGKLKALEKKEWRKQIADLRELLQVEVQDFIEDERKKTMQKRDEVWNKYLLENFVKKEIADSFQQQLLAQNQTISGLNNTLTNKQTVIEGKEREITQLRNSYSLQLSQVEDQVQFLSNENQQLHDQLQNLQKYIDNQLWIRISKEEQRLNDERRIFENEQIEFTKHTKKAESKLHQMFLDNDAKNKELEKREKQLHEQETRLTQREQKLNKFYDEIDHKLVKLKSIKKRDSKQENYNQEFLFTNHMNKNKIG